MRVTELITSGSVNVYPVAINFNSDWDGLVRTAVFRAGGASISVLLDDNECTIPWEVLVKPGYHLEAGVYGIKDGAVVLPTIWAGLGQIREGTEPGENAQPPTPDVLDQALEKAVGYVSQAQSFADQAKSDADRAAQIAADMAVIAKQVSLDAATASKAKEDALAAQGKAELAQRAAETAKQAAEDAANATEDNAAAAATAAARAEDAANAASAALAELQTLYREMRDYADNILAQIAEEGDLQVQRVAAEGAAQVTAATGQADRAEAAAGKSADSAAAAGQAQQGAEDAKAAAKQSAADSADSAKTSLNAANRAEGAAIHQPYPNPETGTWWAWDAETGVYVDTGEPAQGPQGGSGLPDVVTLTGSEQSLALANNTEYRCADPVTGLTISGFAAGPEGKAEMWSIVFAADETITVTVPESVVWAVAEPMFTPGSMYWITWTPMGEKYLAVWVEVEADESADV